MLSHLKEGKLEKNYAEGYIEKLNFISLVSDALETCMSVDSFIEVDMRMKSGKTSLISTDIGFPSERWEFDSSDAAERYMPLGFEYLETTKYKLF